MDLASSLPGSPAGAGLPSPLQLVPLSQQRERDNSNMLPLVRRGADLESGGNRDSSVHEKINQFNSLAMQSKQLERKTADAALKRAMLGREEAESEMRRYRDEAKLLKKQIEEGRERERRVGERLETVMENYGRAKETHAHTQDLWEKEIRRARKEAFKSQSTIVKVREELKSARDLQKRAEDALDHEKERSKAREQEAFQARYSLVGMQEQLDEALERVKMLEQERDAFKTLAKNEAEVSRLAAEGKLPLPKIEQANDEFASPRKPRISSVSLVDVKSSAASEAELEEITEKWMWEKQRAERAYELVDFLEAECNLKCCRFAKSHRCLSAPPSARKRRSTAIIDAGDLVILSEHASSLPSPATQEKFSPRKSKTAILKDEHRQQREQEPRRSTVFVPSEGIFRTVSQEMAESTQCAADAPGPVMETNHEESSVPTEAERPTSSDVDTVVDVHELGMASVKKSPRYWRTPSVDPPSFSVLSQPRSSLLSLLDAPHEQEAPDVFTTAASATTSSSMVPTTPVPDAIVSASQLPSEVGSANHGDDLVDTVPEASIPTSGRSSSCEREAPACGVPDAVATGNREFIAQEVQRPHTSAAYYSVKTVTTTTKVPLREENDDPSLAKRLLAAQRTPAGSRQPQQAQHDLPPSFDAQNPALTPTMTREEALAQIRERRGRARSLARGTATPHKGMMVGVQRRDVSAPTATTGTSAAAVAAKAKFGSVGRRVRS